MKPMVTPIMAPRFDENALAKFALDALGTDPYGSANNTNAWLSDEARFLVALDYLQTSERSVWPSVERAAALYTKHLRYGFAVSCSRETALLLLETNLAATRYAGPEKDLVILSGTLRELVDFVTANAHKDRTFDLRFIADCFHLLLVQLKLENLFCEFSKVTLHDGTFTLKRKS